MNSYSIKIKTATSETRHQLIASDLRSALREGKKAAPKGMDAKIWIYYGIESAMPEISARRSNGMWTNH